MSTKFKISEFFLVNGSLYKSSDRSKNVDRGSMNFYTEDDYHTSDNKDYYRNVWDKGHLAPAATFSDSRQNLKQTFSYLNWPKVILTEFKRQNGSFVLS